jgi:hypothetical protein
MLPGLAEQLMLPGLAEQCALIAVLAYTSAVLAER